MTRALKSAPSGVGSPSIVLPRWTVIFANQQGNTGNYAVPRQTSAIAPERLVEPLRYAASYQDMEALIKPDQRAPKI